MGQLLDAFAYHAGMPVAGIKKNYGLNKAPKSLSSGSLPCIIPLLPTGGAGPGQEIPTVWTTAHSNLILNPIFRFCIRKAGETRGPGDFLPDMVEIWEAYCLALRQEEHRDLGGILASFIELSHPSFGVVDWPEGTSFLGFDVTHTWRIYDRPTG